jgi:hypothetical protein
VASLFQESTFPTEPSRGGRNFTRLQKGVFGFTLLEILGQVRCPTCDKVVLSYDAWNSIKEFHQVGRRTRLLPWLASCMSCFYAQSSGFYGPLQLCRNRSTPLAESGRQGAVLQIVVIPSDCNQKTPISDQNYIRFFDWGSYRGGRLTFTGRGLFADF